MLASMGPAEPFWREDALAVLRRKETSGTYHTRPVAGHEAIENAPDFCPELRRLLARPRRE